MILLAPFLAAYMPVIMIIYWADPSLFAHEVYIFEHDMVIDENDKWIKFFIQNSKPFADEVDEHNKQHEGLRKKK